MPLLLFQNHVSFLQLEAKLKQSKAALFNLQSQNEDMESIIGDSEKKVKQLQSQIHTATNSNNDMQEKVESLEVENKKYLMKIEKLEHELNSHSNDQVLLSLVLLPITCFTG